MTIYCGKYGCKNCKWCKYYPSYNYYEPDYYECKISKEHFDKINAEITYTDEEIDERITRAYTNGEEWNNIEDAVCPYHVEYIPKEIF